MSKIEHVIPRGELSLRGMVCGEQICRVLASYDALISFSQLFDEVSNRLSERPLSQYFNHYTIEDLTGLVERSLPVLRKYRLVYTRNQGHLYLATDKTIRLFGDGT